MPESTIGQRVRVAIAARGLSHADVAREAGMAANSLSRLLMGSDSAWHRPTHEVTALDRVAEVLGLPKAALCGPMYLVSADGQVRVEVGGSASCTDCGGNHVDSSKFDFSYGCR